MENAKPRECRPCAACCHGWLRIEVDDVCATLGSPCPHSARSGCKIYDRRPVDPCQTFICGWRMNNSPLPEWKRPDHCKAIVMLDRMRWRDQPVVLAVSVGARIQERTLDWLRQFAQMNGRPMLWEEYEQLEGKYTGRKRIATFGSPAFEHEMHATHGRGEKLW